jgi:hypothetical protein
MGLAAKVEAAEPPLTSGEPVKVHNPLSEFHNAVGVIVKRSRASGKFLVTVWEWDAWERLGIPNEHLLPKTKYQSSVWFSDLELRRRQS